MGSSGEQDGHTRINVPRVGSRNGNEGNVSPKRRQRKPRIITVEQKETIIARWLRFKLYKWSKGIV
jgi:hypothetical protein